MGTPTAAGTAFWHGVQPGSVALNGALYYVIMPITARLDIISRTAAENFTETVRKANARMPFTCAINGVQYSVSAMGVTSLALGSDALEPEETVPDGQVVRQGTVVAGRSSSNTFYMAFDYLGGYQFGFGDPPLRASRAVGGLGPLIIDGLPYGVGNLCKRPANCPPTGPVPAGMREFMTQRNNATYADQQARPAGTGKAIIATNKDIGRMLVGVQPHGGGGTDFDSLKLWLLELGCDNAVFLDGSDSVMLHARGKFWVQPAIRKDRSNTIGLAFYA